MTTRSQEAKKPPYPTSVGKEDMIENSHILLLPNAPHPRRKV